MKLRRICRSKKVIALVLAILVAFCATIESKAKTIEVNNPNRIEYKIDRKEIGIKNKREMASMAMTTSKITVNGKVYNAKQINVKATAYTSNEGGPLTYTGDRCRWGVIAVDKNIIPLHSKVYIPQFNMVFEALDTGSAIKGNRIDIWHPTYKQAINWGIKDITIYVLD